MKTTLIIKSFLFLLILRINLFAETQSFPDIVFPEDSGVIDITKPPYNAKGDGVTDNTQIINRALKEHNNYGLPNNLMSWTIYFPKGTYLVSNTLEPLDPEDPKLSRCSVRIVGQGRDQTIIKLKDSASGYGDPKSPKIVLQTGNCPKVGDHPNSGFSNYIEHLTVDVGSNNPGAVGIRYDVANCGAMAHVRIVSSDPKKRGKWGLGFYETCGIGYVKDLEVEGFDYGVYFDSAPVNNLALEHISVKDQLVCGIYNVGKNIQIRDFKSQNQHPAVQVINDCASTFIIEAELIGGGSGAAMELKTPSFLYLRDIKTAHYSTPLKIEGAKKPSVTGDTISEWWSVDAEMSKNAASLRLPIKETPEYYEADLTKWASVESFGATKNNNEDDDAPAIQKAIDSGKEIIYFPFGQYSLKSEVVVRGKVKKLDFLFSEMTAADEKAAFRIADVENGSVILEDMTVNVHTAVPIIHDSSGTVTIRNRGGEGKILTGSKAKGDLFVENVGSNVTIEAKNGIHGWFRAINREGAGFLNDASTVWYYSDNVERMLIRSTGKARIRPFTTTHGGKTEILGGAIDAIFAAHKPEDGALFECIDSTLFVTYAGLFYNTEKGKGSWPIHVLNEKNRDKKYVRESDVLYFNTEKSAQRFVLPPYLSTSTNTVKE
jgi:hypothetical protein